MNPFESEKLILNPPASKISTTAKTTYYKNPFHYILEPFQWLKMLSKELNPTFIIGVFLVYGLNQGFTGSFSRVVSDFYWKDVQKVEPAIVQLYVGFYYIPWIMKPVWGLLTDVLPVMGYHRRPYFILAGVLGMVSALIIGGMDLNAGLALVCLVGVAGGVAIAEVIIDACIARFSIEIRSLAADIQSLCGVCASVGALVGYSTSGFFVHHLGAQGALGLLAIPPALLVFLGFVIYELKSSTRPYSKQNKVEKVGIAMKGMHKTIKLPQVWRPSLFMFLSLALSYSTHEGHFYWYTDPKAGPAFSQEFVGVIYAIGAIASIFGVLIYHKTLKNYPFRDILFIAQIFYALSGFLDLIFILRWNLKLRIPDAFFVIMEECATRIIAKIRWMPMIVLSTKLCPLGIEGTFFALLMCIDSLGNLSAKLIGGIVLQALHVTRTDFSNLWLAVLVKSILRVATLGLIFLVPNVGPNDVLVPSDLLTVNVDVGIDSDDDDDDDDDNGVLLVDLNKKGRV